MADTVPGGNNVSMSVDEGDMRAASGEATASDMQLVDVSRGDDTSMFSEQDVVQAGLASTSCVT